MPPGGPARGAARAPAKSVQRRPSTVHSAAGPTAPTPDAEIFRTIFDSAATGLVHTDLNGRILQANPAFRRIVGFTQEDLRAKTLRDLTHPEDAVKAEEPFAKLVQGALPSYEIEKRYLRKDGATVWVHDSVSLTRDGDGRPLYAHAVTQDITERKKAEEAAKRQRELYEAVAAVHDSLGDGVGAADVRTGRFVLVNDAFCRLYGYSREDLLKVNDPLLLCAPEERVAQTERMRRWREGHSRSDRFEIMGLRKDGARVAFEVAARAPGDSDLLVLIVRDVSERRKSERARAQFAALVDSADLAIVGVGLDGVITGWNPAASRIFGWSADEMVGQPFTSIVANDPDALRRAFQRAMRGESLHFESETFRKDATRFPAALTVSPIRDAAGIVVGVSGIVQDESSRRRSEDALHEALSLYSATLESTADGVLVVDLQGTIRSFNRRFVDLWSIPAKILGERDEERCTRHQVDQFKDPAKALARIQEIHATPEKDSVDVLELRDGRFLERLSQPQRIGDRIVGRVWNYRDLTEKIWGEQALQLTRELALALTEARGLTQALDIALSRVAEATGWALAQAWLPAVDGRTLECSRAWFGSAGPLQSFHEHSLGVRFEAGVGLPGRVWKTGKPVWLPDVRDAPNSPRAPAARKATLGAALAVPVLAHGEVVGVLEFFLREPRTEDVRLAQLVAAVAAQLGIVVQKKRAEQALAEQAEELARINQDLEQFVYFASHDLREPLHVVLGYMQRLERRYRTGEAEYDAMWDFAVKGAVHMQELIKDLLGYARLGKTPPSWQPVDLNEAVDQAVTALKWDVEENHAQVTRVKLPTLEADQRGITQVLQNLISNGVKFHRPKTRPQIRVEAEREGNAWHVRVRDNGIGIRKADQDRIFVMFQRLHTQEEYPGTGIGLAICKKIVEKHGGRIWVESEAGKGSTFHFTIPERGRAAE